MIGGSEMACEKCGGRMVARQEGSMQGLFCEKCGWSLVTTHIPEIERDRTRYEVSVYRSDYRNHEHIKAVANITGLNSLAARKLLQEDEPVIFHGEAREVARVRETLRSAEMAFRIKPDFPW